MNSLERIARAMWAAYCKAAGGVTFDNKPLPAWDGLGEDRQMCWVAAAQAGFDEYKAVH